MATVTMDIAELDKLRQDLKERTEKQEALTKEINDVKSDKRVVVRSKPVDENSFAYSFDEQRYRHYLRNNSGGYGFSSIKYLKECITIYPLKDAQEKSTEFINFEDAKIELLAQLEEKYKDELADLRVSKKYFDNRLRDKQKEFEEAQKVLINQHNEREALKQQDIDDLQKKYDELESGKKELSKIEELQKIIENLEANLKTERNRSWWNKLLGR